MNFRTIAAAAFPLLAALAGAAPAHADEWVILKGPDYPTTIVADLTTQEAEDGVIYTDILIFPRNGGAVDLKMATSALTCGRNIMNAFQIVSYDLKVTDGELSGVRELKKEISDWNEEAGTGTLLGLDNSVYAALEPLCSGVPAGARRVSGDENEVLRLLAGDYVK